MKGKNIKRILDRLELFFLQRKMQWNLNLFTFRLKSFQYSDSILCKISDAITEATNDMVFRITVLFFNAQMLTLLNW